MKPSKVATAWIVSALVMPLLLTYAYVAQDQWRHPGHAGWAAWAVYPYGVGIGVIAAFMVPLRRMWMRVVLAFAFGLLLAAGLFFWSFFLACAHGDCI